MSSAIPQAGREDAVRGRLDAITERVRGACVRAGRSPDAVRLIAVSKFHGEAAVISALESGHRGFGESRVQEARAKWSALRESYPDVELHLIGSLQTNKAIDAVRTFDVIHTVDRVRLATALARAMEREGRRPACLVQVDTGDEPQKGGVAPAGLDALLRECKEGCGLAIYGLMCIPPAQQDPAPHFRLLRKLAAEHGLAELSMGMTADFETAIAEGATMVRVGSAIFGPRPAPAASGAGSAAPEEP
ncbi:YggS family pyridoxal phosphate-dependent enzyme [Actinocrinis sp.]|uniref:YggS family pyridoxal phosphate-dependent enzyme n=1 Tax=Actinocrinis sp. TaxID=1920516 RepID=UPI002D2A8F7C|nr:YggS family pyridoxal phosphate-dependent enzyme [Actinocrinis sp.]HZP53958.1 YggS family pyridoxal phosphate-dependent enzyme [Actinocrinis sp.]